MQTRIGTGAENIIAGVLKIAGQTFGKKQQEEKKNRRKSIFIHFCEVSV